MWGYDHKHKLWVVKRNSGNPEYYKNIHDLNSWKKVDLSELSRAPFHNPSQNASASNFRQFLDKHVKEKFPSMKTTKALVRKDKDIINPETNQPMKIMLWPATNQVREIPIPQHFINDILNVWNFGPMMMKQQPLP